MISWLIINSLFLKTFNVRESGMILSPNNIFHSTARTHALEKTVHVARVTAPLFLVFVGHVHLQHTAARRERMSFLCNHALLVPSQISMNYAVAYSYGTSISIQPSATQISDREKAFYICFSFFLLLFCLLFFLASLLRFYLYRSTMTPFCWSVIAEYRK